MTGTAEQAKKYRARHPDRVRETNRIQHARRNKAAHNAEMREWRKNNPRAAKNADLKKVYGISIDRYEEMLKQQHGVCAVCKEPNKRRALAVDHCHETGLVRGLLCDPCNRALGFLRECPERINALREYIHQFLWLK